MADEKLTMNTDATPQKTAAAPQKTAVAPQKTAAAPQKTAVAGPGFKASGNEKADEHSAGEIINVGGKSLTVEKLIGRGTEGDLYLVTDKKKQYALKLCHKGFRTNTKVMPALEKLKGRGYLADVVAYDDSFELSEYVPEGNAASAALKGNARAILAMTVKIAMTLDAMHGAGVLHKDVKPANILIKSTESWDCVLCDFGIADLLDGSGTCATLQLRTPVYAAPEVYSDTVTIDDGTYIELTPKSDFYSLGMTILSLWMGEGAFLAQERTMAIDKVKGRIAVPADMPDPLAKICRGLLIRDPVKRWNLDEIERTMNGEDVPVDEALIIEDLNITFNATKRQIANTPEQLADFMDEDVELAKKYLYRGQVERWLKPYPELATEIQDIVEKRHPKDQNVGVKAAIYLLDPSRGFPLSGYSRENGNKADTVAVTLKDVGNFFNSAVPDTATAIAVGGDVFKEWVYSRNKSLAAGLEPSGNASEVYLLRVQQIDPLSDINLRNDPSHPDYAMTGEGLGSLLNKVYHIFWNICGGDASRASKIWTDAAYLPMNLEIPISTVLSISMNFMSPEDYHYLTKAFDTKGSRFEKQRQWFVYCTDHNSDDYKKKAGPKDDTFRAQAAWMKVIKGFGATPEYTVKSSGNTYTLAKAVLALDSATLRDEYDNRGLRGFLAVCHQEDPAADLGAQFAYENLLHDYLEDLRGIDGSLGPVERFDEARREADRILSAGKATVTGLGIRSVLQRIVSVLFAFIPMLLLFLMLVFSIIDNPVVDVSKASPGGWVWVLGLILGGVAWIWFDFDGFLVPTIIGVAAASLLELLVKFLGAYILYFFAIVVLAALVFLSIKTVFDTSAYARRARKFTKPGFDEKVLEPLYYAFSDEGSFDSSLNGAFNDNEINNWKGDLKRRRIFTLIFIGTAWLMLAFSLKVPKSERFERFTTPLMVKVDKVLAGKEPRLVEASILNPGDNGEQVVALQKFLQAAGYSANKPDGDYGPGTKKAVSAYQLAAGLDVTGIADRKTLKRINKTEVARALVSGTDVLPPPAAAPKVSTPTPKTAAPATRTPSAAPKANTNAPAKPASQAPVQPSEKSITLEQLKAVAKAAKEQKQ